MNQDEKRALPSIEKETSDQDAFYKYAFDQIVFGRNAYDQDIVGQGSIGLDVFVWDAVGQGRMILSGVYSYNMADIKGR